MTGSAGTAMDVANSCLYKREGVWGRETGRRGRRILVGRIYLRGFFGSRGALGPLLGALGRSWDALGALLGLSWALLEMIFASTFVQVAFVMAS